MILKDIAEKAKINRLTEKKVRANVGKYIYHLSYKRNRDGILQLGLNYRSKYKNEWVFAHNTNRFEMNWYWFCLDIYELDLSHFYGNELEYVLDDKSQLRCCVNHFYDIWRIDTDIAGKDWVIDYVGLYDMPNRQEDYYVKRTGSIDTKALTLCCIDKSIEEQITNTKRGIDITYFNPIIPRNTYITKYGYEPEEEGKLLLKDSRPFVMHSEDNKSVVYWKKLNKLNFSLQEELALVA
jgi:hypothetical protein